MGMRETTASQAPTAHCLRCGRVLRSAKSIATGYGPTCSAKIRKAEKAATDTVKPVQLAKAVELIELGAITPIRARRVFRVVSSKGDQNYLTAATGQCNCPAGLKGRYGCYHAAAAAILAAA